MEPRGYREAKKDPVIAVVSGLVIVILIALYLYHFWFQNAELPASAPAPVAPVAETPPAPAEPQVRHPMQSSADTEPLPLLEESDAPIRQALTGLMDGASLERLFHLDSIVRRFVVTVDELPRKKLPRRYSVARPLAGKFAVVGQDETLAIHSRNSRNYAPYVRLAESMETGKLVAVYTYFYPLLQEEYRNLAPPDKYLNDRVVEAIDDLLAAPELTQPPRLIQNKVLYEFADPALEDLSAGQKIMIRMGGDNAVRIKAKLREIRGAITAIQ